MARAALQIGVRELAEASGVSAMTITRFETGKSGGYATTLDKLTRALEAAGVEFIAENGSGPGVRLKKASGQL
ncbi:MAG: helix-turn-helix transcriptional regulator [Alphaproteobacteria bacterium]|nr:helix-turn-helix transcriptional regulator [Alphaproteobacteria bacterium]